MWSLRDTRLQGHKGDWRELTKAAKLDPPASGSNVHWGLDD